LTAGILVLPRFSKAQTEMPMSRDRKKHYILSPEERQRLLALGAEINHEIKDALVIVTCQTYQRWVIPMEEERIR
jgi:hypothetical protein